MILSTTPPNAQVLVPPLPTPRSILAVWTARMAEIELEPENEEEEEEESGLMFLVYRGCITNDKIIL